MVSIIVPVYQVADYVERCIRSVMEQSYTDIECIVVNDGTLDGKQCNPPYERKALLG